MTPDQRFKTVPHKHQLEAFNRYVDKPWFVLFLQQLYGKPLFMSDKPVTIYGICDPRTSELRYVGKTVFSLKERLYRHVKYPDKSHRGNWFKRMVKLGVIPEIFIIEFIETGNDWIEAERFWIGYFRFIGCRLVNGTGGGEGAGGVIDTPEVRLKKSLASKGKPKSDAHRVAILATGTTFQKGHTLSRGRPVSDITRQRISEKQKGVPKKGWSDEHKAAHKLRMTGKGLGRKAAPEKTARYTATMNVLRETGWTPIKKGTKIPWSRERLEKFRASITITWAKKNMVAESV